MVVLASIACGAREEASRIGVPFLGEVPLHMAIRETSDAGKPCIVANPEGEHAERYRKVALKVAALLGEAEEDDEA